MTGKIPRYQPQREDILINSDWGIVPDRLTSEQAAERSLILFRGRYVTEEEAGMLRRQLWTYRLIRLVAVYFLLCFVGCLAGWMRFGFAPTPGIFLGALTAVLLFVGLWRFNRVAWLFAIVLMAIVFVISILAILSPTREHLSTVPYPYFLFGGFGFVALLCLGVLLSSTSREIFASRRRGSFWDTVRPGSN